MTKIIFKGYGLFGLPEFEGANKEWYSSLRYLGTYWHEKLTRGYLKKVLGHASLTVQAEEPPKKLRGLLRQIPLEDILPSMHYRTVNIRITSNFFDAYDEFANYILGQWFETGRPIAQATYQIFSEENEKIPAKYFLFSPVDYQEQTTELRTNTEFPKADKSFVSKLNKLGFERKRKKRVHRFR